MNSRGRGGMRVAALAFAQAKKQGCTYISVSP